MGLNEKASVWVLRCWPVPTHSTNLLLRLLHGQRAPGATQDNVPQSVHWEKKEERKSQQGLLFLTPTHVPTEESLLHLRELNFRNSPQEQFLNSKTAFRMQLLKILEF